MKLSIPHIDNKGHPEEISPDRWSKPIIHDSDPKEGVLTTPAVRKIAKDFNINLKLVKATGPKNRITKEDVLVYINQAGKNNKNFQSNSQGELVGSPEIPGKAESKFVSANSLISQSSAFRTNCDKVRTSSSVQLSGSASGSNQNLGRGLPIDSTSTVSPIRGVQRMMMKSMTASLEVKLT